MESLQTVITPKSMGTACGVHTLQQGHPRVAELAVQVTVTGL